MRFEPIGDAYRVRVDCTDRCGAVCVVTITHAFSGRPSRCIDCGRRHWGAPVPQRPAPGWTRHNGLGMGQPGASFPGRVTDRATRTAERAVAPAYLDEGEVEPGHPAVTANAAGLHARASALAERARRRHEPARVRFTLTRTAAAHLVLRVRAGAVRGWFGWTAGAPTGGQFLRPDGSIAMVNFTQARAYLDGGTLPPRRVVEVAGPAKPKDPAALYAATMVRYGPRGVWHASGTALAAPYPCRCFEGRDRWACEHGRCPCWGRTDVANIRAGCCALGWLAQREVWRRMIAADTLSDGLSGG